MTSHLTLRAAMLCGFAAAAFASPVPGWFLAGPAPADYSAEIDQHVTHLGRPAACIRSVVKDAPKFGTLMQTFSANRYKGKRVRLSGYVKSDRVANWAGLWMRVDAGRTVLVLDNMQQRAIRGTADWTRYDVVLDVGDAATDIAIGILLNGTGTVWLSQLSFEEVDMSVAVTSAPSAAPPLGPVNLAFEQK